MNDKTRFLGFISLDHSIDYWSDVAIEEAIALADKMSNTEWCELSEVWTELEPVVQERIAEVAGETSKCSSEVVTMLVSMLSSDQEEVVSTSLDSLYSIYQYSPRLVDSQVLGRALDGLEPSSTVVSKILNLFRQALSKEIDDGM